MLKATIKVQNGTETTGDFTQEFLDILYSSSNMTSIRIYDENDVMVYDNNTSNYLNIWYEGGLLKSTLKTLEFELDSIQVLPKGKEFNDVQIGLSGDTGTTFYYISLGKFICDSYEHNIENETTKVTCYDEMCKFMKPYGEYGEIIYSDSTTNLSFLQSICNLVGISLDLNSFSNEILSLPRNTETYTYEFATYRDVLDDFAEILGGCILIKNNKLTFNYPKEVGLVNDFELVTHLNENIQTQNEENITAITYAPIVIDEEQLKSLSVGNPFEKVTTLVLSRSPQNDNATITTSLPGETIKLDNNLLVEGYREVGQDTADRTPYLQPILNKLQDWGAFYELELDSFGYLLFEPGDKVTVHIKDKYGTLNEYPIIWTSSNLKVSPGIDESVECKAPELSEGTYQQVTTTKKEEMSVYLYVDKVDKTITSKVSSNTNRISQIIQDASGLTGFFANASGAKYIRLSSQGIQISEQLEGSSSVLINEDGVNFYNDDQVQVASMRENEFDTTNWVYKETRNGNCLNIFKRRTM